MYYSEDCPSLILLKLANKSLIKCDGHIRLSPSTVHCKTSREFFVHNYSLQQTVTTIQFSKRKLNLPGRCFWRISPSHFLCHKVSWGYFVSIILGVTVLCSQKKFIMMVTLPKSSHVSSWVIPCLLSSAAWWKFRLTDSKYFMFFYHYFSLFSERGRKYWLGPEIAWWPTILGEQF